MIEISFRTGIGLTLFGWILYRMAHYLKNRKPEWKNEFKQLFFLVNLLVIVRFTFYPFSKVDGQVQPLIFETNTAYPFRVNLVPFVNMMDYDSVSDLLLNLIGNFAMFIPTGVMTPMIYKSRNNLKKVLTTGFLISLCIELIQLPFAVRASDVDDLILNTAGVLVGYGLYAIVRQIRRHH